LLKASAKLGLKKSNNRLSKANTSADGASHRYPQEPQRLWGENGEALVGPAELRYAGKQGGRCHRSIIVGEEGYSPKKWVGRQQVATPFHPVSPAKVGKNLFVSPKGQKKEGTC
jgi:hypothetical protein